MKRRLHKEEIEYVWMHMEHHFEIDLEVKSLFTYINDISEAESHPASGEKRIFFLSLEQEISKYPFLDDGNNLVLFPGSQQKVSYQISENKLIFYHDYLKSIFYFISGYQEWRSGALDQYGRFEYKVSIQSDYNLDPLPFANEMMELIGKGLAEFCKMHNLSFQKRPLFDRGVFLLSHDIDHIRYYRPSYFKYKLKEIAGIVRNKKYTRFQLIDQAVQGLISGVTGRQDPAWSFEFLNEVNHKYGIKSTYFFLNKESPKDGSYDLLSPSARSIINKIDKWGNEIGVHGPMASSVDMGSATKILNNINEVSPQATLGIRQHWLIYRFPETTRIHQSLGYQYDATLGFNDRAGFRHAYCFPFKLWDFDNKKPFDVWQIPLCIMDVTLLSYMNLSLEECLLEIQKWEQEVTRHKGVYSILWHNTTLNEVEIPGVKEAYQKILEISTSNLDGKTHAEVVNYMENR